MRAARVVTDIMEGKPSENVSRETQQKPPSSIIDAWMLHCLPTLSTSAEGCPGDAQLFTSCCCYFGVGRVLTG